MVEAGDSTVKTTMYSSHSFKEDVDNSMNTQAVSLYSVLQGDKPESTATDNFTTYPEPAPSYSKPIETMEKIEPESGYVSLYATIAELKSDEPPISTPDIAPPVIEETPEPAVSLPQPDVGILTTGQHLRQLREQKHLTIQNVADKLYLDNSVIQALENDSYETLPPPIFVRGYLRGYAKILEVPATALIEKYDAYVGHKPPPPIISQAKPKKQATTNDLWVKALTYIIFLTLMVLMVLWGVSHYALLTPTPDANSSNSSSQGENLNVGEGEYMPPTEGEDEKLNPTVGAQPVVSNPPPPPVTPPPPPPPPVDLRALKIHYSKNGSWTRVTDAKGVKAYEGTPKTGETIDVKGEPPFKVRFGAGNAGIEIEYKGQKAAAETYPKSNRNITIGEPIPATPPPASPSNPTPAPTPAVPPR
jgi:cytoskeleton protein RodZ